MTAPALPIGVARRRSLRGAAAAALAVAAAIAGSLALGHAPAATHSAARAPDLNSLIHGATLQRARCSNWLAASPAERRLAVQALAASVGAPTEYRGLRGSALTSAQTYQLFDNACSTRMAGNFLLYELYIRAAGFRSALGGNL